MQDLHFDAVAGDKTPGVAIKEAGPHFPVGKVDQDIHVGIRRRGNRLPVDLCFHFCLSFWLLL